MAATGSVADRHRPAAGPLIPGPAPTPGATGASPAAAAKPIAEKATGATGGPRHAATRLAIIQTAARHHRVGPHREEITDPGPDPHNVRGGTRGKRGEQNVGRPGLHPEQMEAHHSLHRDLQV